MDNVFDEKKCEDVLNNILTYTTGVFNKNKVTGEEGAFIASGLFSNIILSCRLQDEEIDKVLILLNKLIEMNKNK